MLSVGHPDIFVRFLSYVFFLTCRAKAFTQVVLSSYDVTRASSKYFVFCCLFVGALHALSWRSDISYGNIPAIGLQALRLECTYF